MASLSSSSSELAAEAVQPEGELVQVLAADAAQREFSVLVWVLVVVVALVVVDEVVINVVAGTRRQWCVAPFPLGPSAFHLPFRHGPRP